MRAPRLFRWPAFTAATLMVLPALAQSSFVAPPRSIKDINALLDQEKPDPSRAARNRTDADIEPQAGADQRTQVQTYFRRAQARAALGRNREAVADLEQAVALGTAYMNGLNRPPQVNQYY